MAGGSDLPTDKHIDPIGDDDAQLIFMRVGKFLHYWEEMISIYHDMILIIHDGLSINIHKLLVFEQINSPHRQFDVIGNIIENSPIFVENGNPLSKKILKNLRGAKGYIGIRNNIAHGVVVCFERGGVNSKNMLVPARHKSNILDSDWPQYSYNASTIDGYIEAIRDIRWEAIALSIELSQWSAAQRSRAEQ
ncbi:MAG: hypothetical protein Q8S29_12390 [Phreatobacter sp.]|nr:hypothetical protein [Phreatobacter sp.]